MLGYPFFKTEQVQLTKPEPRFVRKCENRKKPFPKRSILDRHIFPLGRRILINFMNIFKNTGYGYIS